MPHGPLPVPGSPHPRGATPWRRRTPLTLAADVSVILTWWQLRDGVADHGFFRGLPYRAALLLLRRAYRKARARRPGFDAYTQAHLEDAGTAGGGAMPLYGPGGGRLRGAAGRGVRGGSGPRAAAGAGGSCSITWAGGSIWWTRQTT